MVNKRHHRSPWKPSSNPLIYKFIISVHDSKPSKPKPKPKPKARVRCEPPHANTNVCKCANVFSGMFLWPLPLNSEDTSHAHNGIWKLVKFVALWAFCHMIPWCVICGAMVHNTMLPIPCFLIATLGVSNLGVILLSRRCSILPHFSLRKIQKHRCNSSLWCLCTIGPT